MRKPSPKLPAFAGRCHIQLLPGAAAHAADTARHLATFRALAPAPTSLRRPAALVRVALLLCLLSPLTCCLPVRPKAPKPAPKPDYRTEHPTLGGRYAWQWDDEPR